MSDNSTIQWTDATWGPTLGCTKVSTGCEHCYAMVGAHIRQSNPNPKVAAAFEGLTRKFPDGSVNWTGRVNLLEDRLSIPLHWKKPRRIFVDSQSDLFHEAVPDDFIDRVFAVMAVAQQHTYQVLTKRPERMRAYFDDIRYRTEQICIDAELISGLDRYDELTPRWVLPLPNVWLGTSCENQAAADERIPLILQTPAAVRFISAEPLLGPIDLRQWLPHVEYHLIRSGGPISVEARDALDAMAIAAARQFGPATLDWVITGGESGPNHRPFDPQWARDIRDACVAAGVCFFHKQNGGRTSHAGGRLLDGREHNEMPRAAVPA